MSASITLAREHWTAEAIGAVRETVRMFRLRGNKTPHAMEQAALALELSTRRVRSVYNGELFSIPLQEYSRIKSRFLAHLDVEAAELEERAEALRLRRQQLEIKWSESSGVGFACCDTAEPSAELNALDKAEARYNRARRGVR